MICIDNFILNNNFHRAWHFGRSLVCVGIGLLYVHCVQSKFWPIFYELFNTLF